MNDENNFDPKELEYISRRMKEIVDGENEGYEMIFYISQNDVEDLLDNYERAENNDRSAIRKCWVEYSKIMSALKEATQNND